MQLLLPSIRFIQVPGHLQYLVCSYVNSASANDILMTRIEYVANLFVSTPVNSLVNSTLAEDFMNDLQNLMKQQRRLVVGNVDADDLLAKLTFLIAPVSRIADSLNEYFKNIKFATADGTAENNSDSDASPMIIAPLPTRTNLRSYLDDDEVPVIEQAVMNFESESENTRKSTAPVKFKRPSERPDGLRSSVALPYGSNTGSRSSMRSSVSETSKRSADSNEMLYTNMATNMYTTTDSPTSASTEKRSFWWGSRNSVTSKQQDPDTLKKVYFILTYRVHFSNQSNKFSSNHLDRLLLRSLMQHGTLLLQLPLLRFLKSNLLRYSRLKRQVSIMQAQRRQCQLLLLKDQRSYAGFAKFE